MQKCRFKTKSYAYEIVRIVDFEKWPAISMQCVNDFVNGCAKNCPEHKCLAYRGAMAQLADLYKEHKNGRVN